MLKIITLLYILATAVGLVLIKLGSTSGAPVAIIDSKLAFNVNLHIIIGGILYVISFLLYMYLISKFDLGYIIPLTTGLVYALIFIASFFIFKEAFTAIKILAIMMILGGVLLLNVK
jgi:drug/metabolite transporter (DMT)-like permease